MRPPDMRVQLLSPYPDLASVISYAGGELVETDPDFIVSFGHREIIHEPMLSKYAGRIVNLHLSYLPWNRGADPNFWSWYDATPKGVTLHHLTRGLDTGPIIAQRHVEFDLDSDTLASSYWKLRLAARDLFVEAWPTLPAASTQDKASGTYHRTADKTELMTLFPLKFDTLCRDVAEVGRQSRGEAST